MEADFLLVIPAFEESGRLPGFLNALAAQLKTCSFSTAIRVVDDGSRAGERRKLLAAVQQISLEFPSVLPVLVLPHNLGKGGAIMAGWTSGIAARWLAFVDADGSVPAEEVVRVFSHALSGYNPRSCYFASRIRMLGRAIQRSWFRHLIGRIYATLVGHLIHSGVYDSQCGLKVIASEAFTAVKELLHEQRFTFDVELLAALLHCGFPVEEVPIDWCDVPGSKVRLFRDTVQMAQSLMRIRSRRRRWEATVHNTNERANSVSNDYSRDKPAGVTATSVTAVIPTYNYGRYLSEAIESALKQTYPPLEIIVVDDGSTDNTPEVARRYGDCIRYARTPNQGVAAARNTAIRLAKGELVAFLDADDRWLPTKIEQQVALFQANPEIGMVHAGSRIFDSDSGATLCEILPEAKIGFHDVLAWNGVSLPSAVVPRKVFDDVGGFDEKLCGTEDWELWIRIAAKYELVSCREVLVEYRMHGNNLSTKAEEMFNDCMAVLDKSERIHPHCIACAAAIKSARQRVRKIYYDKSSAIARDYLRGGNYLHGFAWRVWSVWRYPQILLEAPRILNKRYFCSSAN